MLQMQSSPDSKLGQAVKRLLLITILFAIAVVPIGCGSSSVAVSEHMSIGSGHYTEYGIWVELRPTELAVANESYLVDLYEDGQPRATAVVTWNELELDVLKTKTVVFPATKAEFNAYHDHDISHIFKINIRSSPVTVPSESLIACNASLTLVPSCSWGVGHNNIIIIKGNVTNNSEWPIGYVSVVVELLGKNDEVIKYVYIPVSPSVISPGDSGSFDVTEVLTFTEAYSLKDYRDYELYPYSFEDCRYYPVWEWIPPQPSS